MKTLWTGLLFLLFSTLACADTKEDYAQQIVDSLRVDEMFAAQYAIWDDYEQQLLRTQAEQDRSKATQKKQINKDMLQLTNSLPQHDVHFARLYKEALLTTLLKNFNEEELHDMAQRFNSPRAKKIIGLVADLDKHFTEIQTEAAAQRLTGSHVNTPVPTPHL